MWILGLAQVLFLLSWKIPWVHSCLSRWWPNLHTSTLHGESSMIDLVFASKPTSIQTCGCHHAPQWVLHTTLLVTHLSRWLWTWVLFSRKPHTRRIWHYRDADFEMANDLLDNTPWASLLNSEDVNTSWINWKSFLEIMSLCVPSKTISLKKRPPWLSKKLLVEIEEKCTLPKGQKNGQTLSLGTLQDTKE